MNQQARPLVTVITPAYNRAPFLEETIESVLDQTYPNIEYIVLDDGSKDDTIAILERYRGRLVWDSHPNMGEARTVNKGYRMAKGEYITVVNSDDPILPEAIEVAVDYMEAHPELLMTYPDWNVIDHHSQVIRQTRAQDYHYLSMVRRSSCMPGPGAVLRRRALALVPERTTQYRYVTDFEYWLRLGLHGPCARIPQVLATHRHHEESAGVSQYEALSAELVQLMQEFFERPELPPAVRSLRAQGVSAACYDAGMRCVKHDYNLARSYLRRSLRTSLWGWIRERRFRPIAVLVLILPRAAYTHLRAGWLAVKQRFF